MSDASIPIDVVVRGATRAMRFSANLTGDEMIKQIVGTQQLAPRSDYVLFLPPAASSFGKWLAKGETLRRYLESTPLVPGGALELRRSPYPMVVHMSGDKDLDREEILNNVHSTKRVVVDLSGSGHDAMREFRVLFAALTRQNRNREEYTLNVLRKLDSGSHRLQGLSLGRTFWEQNVTPNSVLVLYPVSRLHVAILKDILSTAVFSGWLQPIKSEAIVSAGSGTPGSKKLGKAGSARPVGSKRRQAFYVLRRNLLFCFKSDAKAERAEQVVILDYYRVEKKPWDTGFVLRLDQKMSGFSSQTTMVFQLHAASEADIDGWQQAISLGQREPVDVFGLTLRQVCNRASNQNEKCPDYLQALVDEIQVRISNDPSRYRCLLAADARPPVELTKGVVSGKTPPLHEHPDMAIAAALRAYLAALPEPLCGEELTSMLQRAWEVDDLKLAASGIALSADAVHAHCLKMVLQVLALVPEAHHARLAELFVESFFGPIAGNDNLIPILEFLLNNASSVLAATDSVRGPETREDAAVAAVPPGGTYATVLFKFEGRNVKELSVNVGDAVCVFRESETGWSQVSRMADGMTGAVPTSYLSYTMGPLVSQSVVAASPPVFSPRASSESNDLARTFLQYDSFETRAIQALMMEREAKKRMDDWLCELESASS